MAKRGLQGLAVGIFFTTALLTYFYFFQTKEVESHKDETEIPKIEMSSEEMMDKLAEQGFVVLEEDEYQSLLKAKEEIENEEKTEQSHHHDVLIVQPGMNGTQVAELLHELKIIDNPEAFIQYLIDQKLTTKIEVGEFKLHSGMSYDEIARIITEKKNGSPS